jgi:hypothetical protein
MDKYGRPNNAGRNDHKQIMCVLIFNGSFIGGL